MTEQLPKGDGIIPHKFDPRNLKKLEERRNILPPHEVLRELGLGPGETMVDVGAGAGYFSLPAAEIVGGAGLVIAVDTSREMLEELASRAREACAENIEIVLSSEYSMGVPDGIGDLALLSMVLHEVEDKTRFLSAVRETVKRGGRLAIMEWIKKPMEKGPPLHDRIDEVEASGLLRSLGFTEIESRQYNDFFYLMTAMR